MSSYAWIHGKKVFLEQHNKTNLAKEDSDLKLFRVKNQQIKDMHFQYRDQMLNYMDSQVFIKKLRNLIQEESQSEFEQNQDTDVQQSCKNNPEYDEKLQNQIQYEKINSNDEEQTQIRSKELSFQCKNQQNLQEQNKQESINSLGSKQINDENNVAKQLLSLQTQQTTEKTDKLLDSLRETPKKKDFIFLNKLAAKIKTPKNNQQIKFKPKDKTGISELTRILAEKKFKSIEIISKNQYTQTIETFQNRIMTKSSGQQKNNQNKIKSRQIAQRSVSPLNTSCFELAIELRDQAIQTEPLNVRTQEPTPRKKQVLQEISSSKKKRFYIPLHERFPYEMERKKQLLTRIRKKIEDQEEARRPKYRQDDHRVSVFNSYTNDHSFVREKENYEEIRLQKELEQLRLCTYSPKISQRSKQIATKRFESQGYTKTEDRLLQFAVEKQTHIRQLTQEIESKTMLPFKISHNSKEIMKRINISPQNSIYYDNEYKRNFDNQYSYIQEKNLNSSWF